MKYNDLKKTLLDQNKPLPPSPFKIGLGTLPCAIADVKAAVFVESYSVNSSNLCKWLFSCSRIFTSRFKLTMRASLGSLI